MAMPHAEQTPDSAARGWADDPPLGVIGSVVDLVRIAQEPEAGTCLFRGQQVDVRPEPKTRRNSPPYKVEEERALLAEFQRRARPLLAFEPEGPLEWLALADHHGLPTRLLDWTESILVAAFFAVDGFAGEGQPVLVRAQGSEVLQPTDDPFQLDINGIYRPRHVAGRISAQGGLFTVHGMEAGGPFDRFAMARWHIRPEAVPDIQRTLDRLGVNAASLFPDLDGLCRWLAWRHDAHADSPAAPAGRDAPAP